MQRTMPSLTWARCPRLGPGAPRAAGRRAARCQGSSPPWFDDPTHFRRRCPWPLPKKPCQVRSKGQPAAWPAYGQPRGRRRRKPPTPAAGKTNRARRAAAAALCSRSATGPWQHPPLLSHPHCPFRPPISPTRPRHLPRCLWPRCPTQRPARHQAAARPARGSTAPCAAHMACLPQVMTQPPSIPLHKPPLLPGKLNWARRTAARRRAQPVPRALGGVRAPAHPPPPPRAPIPTPCPASAPLHSYTAARRAASSRAPRRAAPHKPYA
jgi:hypothetical protein